MIGRLPLSARVGRALILAPVACFGVWACWNSTRTWVPLDVPISLSRGHIRTPEFKINVESTYSIGIATDWPWDFDRACLMGVEECGAEPSVLVASWSVSGKGRVEVRGDSAGHEAMFEGEKVSRVLGTLRAGKGHYILDVDFALDGSRLNTGAPHLVVLETGGVREQTSGVGDCAILLFMLLAPVGAFLFIRSAAWRRAEELEALARASSLTRPWAEFPASLAVAGAGTSQFDAVGRLQRTSARLTASVYARTTGARLCLGTDRSKKPAFARVSWYGLIAVQCCLVLAVPACFLQFGFRPIPVGLRVHIPRPPAPTEADPGIQPICVRLESHLLGEPPGLFVDEQPVPWEDFETVLRKGLSLRPPIWPVYFQGDPNMEWKWALVAVDRIRGLQAEVSLVPYRTLEMKSTSDQGPLHAPRARGKPTRRGQF